MHMKKGGGGEEVMLLGQNLKGKKTNDEMGDKEG